MAGARRSPRRAAAALPPPAFIFLLDRPLISIAPPAQLEAVEKDFAELGPRVVRRQPPSKTASSRARRSLARPPLLIPERVSSGALNPPMQDRDAEAARQEEQRKLEERKKRVEAQKAERCVPAPQPPAGDRAVRTAHLWPRAFGSSWPRLRAP